MGRRESRDREAAFTALLPIWLKDKKAADKIDQKLRALVSSTRKICQCGYPDEARRYLTRCITEFQQTSTAPPSEGWEQWAVARIEAFMEHKINLFQKRARASMKACMEKSSPPC